MIAKKNNDAMLRQIQRINQSLWGGGDGARISCEKCEDSFELIFSFGSGEQAFRATIAAAKEYGWKISKRSVRCDKCEDCKHDQQ